MNQKPRVSGAFFPNEYPTGPTYKGFVEIDGVKTEIVLWEKTAASSGKAYLQVSENKKKVQGAAPAPQRQQNFGGGAGAFRKGSAPNPPQDIDDDIPF